MQYRTLGRTGVQVSTLALGAMNFGAIGRTTQDEATAIVDAALDGGINLIDTADMYSQGESEEMVGKAIAGRRDDIVLATKAAMPMGDERNHQGSSRRWLVTELDNSLRRLGVDHVDLYQIHRWDPTTSDEETLSALTDLQRAGQDPLLRLVDVPRLPHRAGPVGRPRAPPGPLRHRAAQLLDPAARHRDPRPAGDRSSTGSACWRGARWPRAGCRARSAPAGRSPPAGRRLMPQRFDLAVPGQPGPARRRRAAGQGRRPGRR